MQVYGSQISSLSCTYLGIYNTLFLWSFDGYFQSWKNKIKFLLNRQHTDLFMTLPYSKNHKYPRKCSLAYYCGKWVQRRVLVLFTAIAEHDDTVSLTLRFVIRKIRLIKIQKLSMYYTILYILTGEGSGQVRVGGLYPFLILPSPHTSAR